MSDPIEIECLRKEFKDFVAVNNLTLKVKKNSFTGLLGPNGAGKSTTLKILTNLISATSGTAYLNGIDVVADAKNALNGVGTVVETPEFYSYLTPIQTFQYIGDIFGMTKENISAQTAEILEMVNMTEWGDKKIGTFSKGMRQRIALGLSVLNNPSIIILDEPTSGLDPRGMAETRDILRNLRNSNKNLTILMSSHMLHEVSDLCDRIAIINHGTLMMEGDMEEALGAKAVKTVVVKLIGDATDSDVAKVKALPNVMNVETSSNVMRVTFKGTEEDQMALLRGMTDAGLKMYCFNEGEALENLYLNLIRETQ